MFKRMLLFLSLLCLSSIAYGSELTLPAWLQATKHSDKLSVGLVAAQEFRFVEETKEIDGGTVTESRFKALGVITVAVLKYNVVEYFRLFSGYGIANRQFFSGTQVAVIGVEYVDVFGVTLLGGTDLGKGLDRLGYKENWFVGLGIVFTGLEFDIGEIDLK